MKRFSFCLLLMFTFVSLAGCGTGLPDTNSETGSISFQIDFSVLSHKVNSAAKSSDSILTAATVGTTAIKITAVSVSISRDGYADVAKDLSVSNNVASGTVAGLEQGYWHVTANVFAGQMLIYTGSVDVNIVAGVQVAAEILFDPVDSGADPSTTGSVSLTVGVNKFPGYSKIHQFVSTILQDKISQKFYIFDSSTGVLAVYSAGTLVREKDITLPSSPQTLAVDAAGGSVLLGYSTGKIYRLNIADQNLTLLADSLLSVTALLPISSKFLLAGNGDDWGPSNTYEIINLENGQIVSSKSYWYPLYGFTYNSATGRAYALDSGLSPADIHCLTINASTGTIDSISDSSYHGDYNYGSPIRILNGGSRIATGSGNMFISSSSAADDITYAGNLGHTFIDMVADNDLGNLYMLNSDNIKKLLVINQNTFFTTMSIDIVAEPKWVFDTHDNIIVFVQSGSDYYAKVFSKNSLGLL